MMPSSISEIPNVSNTSFRDLAIFCLQASVLFLVYVLNALPVYGETGGVLAWVILEFAVCAWWYTYKQKTNPLLAIILSLYAIYYSIPVFYADGYETYLGYVAVKKDAAWKAMLLVVLTQVMIVAGWKVGSRFSIGQLFHRSFEESRLLAYSWFIITVQLVLMVVPVFYPEFSLGDMTFIVNGLFNPFLALGIFLFLSQEPDRKQSVVIGLVIIVLLMVIRGLISTMLSEILKPFIVIGILMIGRYSKKAIVAAVIATVLFIAFQPVKGQYRNYVASHVIKQDSELTLQNLAVWPGLVWEYWANNPLIAGENALMPVLNRLSLLPFITHIVDATPSIVPFQNGWTFRFILYSPIPRFLYPDKPIAQEANIWYVTTYGIIPQEIMQTTMVGISHLGEVYVNFGSLGIIPIFFGFGIMLSILGRLLNNPGASPAEHALLAALLPGLISIESTLTGFVVSAAYTLALSVMVLRLAAVKK